MYNLEIHATGGYGQGQDEVWNSEQDWEESSELTFKLNVLPNLVGYITRQTLFFNHLFTDIRPWKLIQFIYR